MANRVLDSWALMAFFEDEPAAEAVEELLDQASREKHRLYMTSVNWAEVYYSTMREVSQEAAEQHAQIIASLPIDIVGIGDDLKLARQAAIYKANHRLSLADAFAAALAKEKKAELVTGDTEFKQLTDEIKIHWLTT
ncbi:MAG: type II toxin-antitoxin system VapC family toxin [Opitutae bacterium]|nr:type II toxin-antitoxin system VapC family toxin [Opitutae bacterium]